MKDLSVLGPKHKLSDELRENINKNLKNNSGYSYFNIGAIKYSDKAFLKFKKLQDKVNYEKEKMEIKKKELEKEKNEPRRPKRNNPKLITQSGETYNPSDKIGIK